MALAVRGSVWDPFNSLVRQMDRDFDNLIRRSFGGRGGAHGFVPAVDVERDGSDVLIKLELPGVDVDKDVDVEVSEGRLTISGQRSSESTSSDDERSGVVVREIRTGAFRREFALPEGVGADQVEAGYDRGVLRVRVRDVVRQAASPTKVVVRRHTDSSKPAVEGADSDTEQN
jgi:HSP20 family protein